jgi:hypothetical protein
MKKTLITAVALAACAGTQLFAQNAKEGVITFALTLNEQASVSTSASTANFGNWSAGPQYYKSTTVKKTTTHVLQAISMVLYKNGGGFSPKAQLVLVQGELGGFFNVGPTLGDYTGPETDLALGNENMGTADTTDFLSTRDDLGAKLATGRHFRPNPLNGLWPPGHHQPWGQIYVKDPGAAGHSTTDPLCVNVTFFFGFTVQECYDCYFLNSFITDSKFTYKSNTSQGPPCCGVPTDLTGSGKDLYYLTLNFDNTSNNPYLNLLNNAYIGNPGSAYAGVTGIGTTGLPGDGITPDLIYYIDSIRSSLVTGQRFVPNVLRFTLNGIVTYTWTMKKVNTADLVYDFVGSASYAANGYGFADLVCSLFTGTVSIAEKINKADNCCQDLPWYGVDPHIRSVGWYGIGWNLFQDQNPVLASPGDLADGSYFASPINIPEDISLHIGFNEWYEAKWQWPQYDSLYGESPSQPESTAVTGQTLADLAGSGLDSPYIATRVPSARGWTNRANTDWPDSGTHGAK